MKPTIYYEIITADKIRSQRIKTTDEVAPDYLSFRISPGAARTYKFIGTSVISKDLHTGEPTQILRTYEEELK